MRYNALSTIFWLFTLIWAQSSRAENLVEIYELALKNDPTLLAAEAQSNAGGMIKKRALAELLPKIEGNYVYSETDTNIKTKSFTSSIVGAVDQEEEAENYSVSLTQNIFNLAAYFGYKQASASSKQAELQFNVEQQNLILRVSEKYFNVLRSKDNLISSLAEEKAIAQQLEQTQQRYEVGLIAITDVHEAQAAYDLAVADRLTNEVNLGIAYEDLATLTGHSHRNLYELSEKFPIVKPTPENIENWISFARENNLSIQLAEEILQAANQNAKVKTALMLPTVTGSASYNKNDSDNVTFQKGNKTYLPDTFTDVEGSTLQLTVNVPIFFGGSKNAERKQAAFERVAEQANLVATTRKTLQDTRSSYLTTVTDTARVQARQRAITSAQSALEATQAGYDAGTRNIVDLLNAQRDLYSAQRDYANTRYDYVINSLKLKQAAGIISPKDIEDINKWLEQPKAVLQSEQRAFLQTPKTF
jgi:outer membrane protein